MSQVRTRLDEVTRGKPVAQVVRLPLTACQISGGIMNESMRGTRLGTSSYEVDKGGRVPVRLTTYICIKDHRMAFPFYADAEDVPDTWTCDCGETAVRLGATIPMQEPARRPRTHYEILRERRSEKELRELLAERLEVLRSGHSVRSA